MSRTSVRLPDDLEAAARKKCRRLDVTLSHVIRQYLEKWARETDSAMYVYIQSEPGLFTVGFYALLNKRVSKFGMIIRNEGIW